MKTTVVLTRPEGDNARLESTLAERGYTVFVQSLLRIAPLPESELPDPPDLAAGDLCIFISANAARMGLPTLMGPMVEHAIMSLAVGPRTAGVLEAEGLSVTLPERADSEGLLALPALVDVENKHIVIVKGEGGRETLTQTLEARGARVEEYVCYRREPAVIDSDNFSAVMTDAEGLVFQANSGQTLTTLSDLVTTTNMLSLLMQPLVVPSQRVADQATELGWRHVVNAGTASDEAFLRALESLTTDATVSHAPRIDTLPPEGSNDPDTISTQGRASDSCNLDEVENDEGPNPEQLTPARVEKSDGVARTLVVMLLLIMGAAGGAGYLLLWPQWLSQQRSVNQLSAALVTAEARQEAFQASLTDRLADLGDSFEARAASRLQDQLRQQAADRADFSEQQQRLLQRLDRLDIRIARLTATDRREWLANEAAFLVRLAAERLLSARDINAALALLGNADALLAEADDPRFDLARRALAQDRSALRAAPVVDMVGLYARFNALAGQTAALTIGLEPEPKIAVVAGEGWRARAQAGWEAALAKLSSYLVVKRRDGEMARLMTPDWEALVRQNLRMLIEQAQIAALSHNSLLYASALDRARVFVSEFASFDPDRVQAITEELAALGQLDIAPALPNLIASRGALADALRRLNDGDRPGDAEKPQTPSIENTGTIDGNGVDKRAESSDTPVSIEG